MGPVARYTADLSEGIVKADPAQAALLPILEQLYQALRDRKALDWKSLLRKKTPIKGLYLWGSVGIGKTYLMDLLFDSLPDDRKMRAHFHRFLFEIQTALKAHQGKTNPLKIIAKGFAKKVDVLFFDEFFVKDIADAMILGELLKALLAEGLVLVTTSNIAPDDLYLDGLQRKHFLPTIDILKQATSVIHMQGGVDHRLRTLKQAGVYFYPSNEKTHAELERCFMSFVHHGRYTQTPLIIQDRPIETIAHARNVVWFHASVLCQIPRSQTDYLTIAAEYPVVLLEGVPAILSGEDPRLIYFIYLIDVFYDARVKLVIGADKPMLELYQGEARQFEYQRTLSRLIEMQSEAYWQLPHLGGFVSQMNG